MGMKKRLWSSTKNAYALDRGFRFIDSARYRHQLDGLTKPNSPTRQPIGAGQQRARDRLLALRESRVESPAPIETRQMRRNAERIAGKMPLGMSSQEWQKILDQRAAAA